MPVSESCAGRRIRIRSVRYTCNLRFFFIGPVKLIICNYLPVYILCSTFSTQVHITRIKSPMKLRSILHLYELLPTDERLITDVLRQIITDNLPAYCKEKISYNVPFFYGNKGIAIVWPATIPRGGIKEGVLLGFWHGNRLKDEDNYLTHGTNKQIFYKIFTALEQIDERAISRLLNEAVELDTTYGGRK